MLVQRIQPQFVAKTTKKALSKNSSKAADKIANVSLPKLEELIKKPGYLQYIMGTNDDTCVASYGDLLPMGFAC